MESVNEAYVKSISSLTKEERNAQRKSVYDDTVKIVNNGWYLNKSGDRVIITDEESAQNIQKNHKIVEIQPLQNFERKETKYYIYNGDCLDAAIFLKNIGHNPVLLNMANNIKPGGGVDYGAGAQEESLFRRSNYFQHLNKSFYPINGGIYSPNVIIFKKGEVFDYELLETTEKISMIAVAAIRHPNLLKTENA